MKKLIPLVLVVSLQAYSQDYPPLLKNNDKTVKDNPGFQTSVTVRTSEGNSHGYSNNIPSAVMSKFLEQFEEAKNVSWFVDPRDVTAYFRMDEEDITVIYRNDGICMCVRRSYEGKLLNRQLKNLLQDETDKGYLISYVTEVQHEQQTTYEISLQNKKSWLIIKIQQGAYGERPEIQSRRSLRKG